MKPFSYHSATAVAAVLLLASVSSGADNEEKEMSLDQAPAAVQEAVKKIVGTNKVGELSRETEDGKTVYEVDFDADGVGHSASFAEDGKVLEEEVEVATKDLPPAVMAALKEVAGDDGEIEEAEKVTADGKTFYEAEVESGDDTFEVKVAEDGKVMSKTEEDDDDDDDDEEDEDDDDKAEQREKK